MLALFDMIGEFKMGHFSPIDDINKNILAK